ncbi:MAG: FAD binding domain-containing protein, partial [Desulfobacterales bacterium]|nr:FAD binding domain-containing protein [Desulfobacterales bacterium]
FALWQDSPDATLIAGGTDLYVGINDGRIRVNHLIDISQIQGLGDISVTKDTIRFGAGVTISRLVSDPDVLAACPVFKQAGEQMASAQVRNAATVAGNIANASPIGDLSVVLLALGATLELTSEKGSRTLPLEEFFLDYKETALEPREIISFMTIPVRPDLVVRFEKSSKRNAVDIASVNSCVTATIKDGTHLSMRAAFGGVAPVPVLAQGIQEIPLNETNITDTAEQVASQFSTISDIRGTGEFRSTLVKNHMIKHLHGIDQLAKGEHHE